MGNYNWTNPKTWEYGELVYTSDMQAQISDNVGFIFEEFPPNWFGAARAILPSSNAATAAQFETTSGENYSPNWSELIFSGSADQAAQWTFRSWFTASEVTGIKIRAYTTDATASTDDVDIVVSVAAVSGGDAMNTKAFTDWTTATIDAATLEDTAHVFATYTIAAGTATDWDSIAVGDLAVLQVKRLGSADELPLDLHVERVWIYS